MSWILWWGQWSLFCFFLRDFSSPLALTRIILDLEQWTLPWSLPRFWSLLSSQSKLGQCEFASTRSGQCEFAFQEQKLYEFYQAVVPPERRERHRWENLRIHIAFDISLSWKPISNKRTTWHLCWKRIHFEMLTGSDWSQQQRHLLLLLFLHLPKHPHPNLWSSQKQRRQMKMAKSKEEKGTLSWERRGSTSPLWRSLKGELLLSGKPLFSLILRRKRFAQNFISFPIC